MLSSLDNAKVVQKLRNLKGSVFFFIIIFFIFTMFNCADSYIWSQRKMCNGYNVILDI